MAFMSARLAHVRTRLALPVALLALLAALLPGALHRDGLHAAGGGAIESITSGCESQHPPRFEPRLDSHRSECPGCLLQLHRAAALPAAATPLVRPPLRLDLAVAELAAPSAAPSRHASPRGPPALPG